MKSLLIPVENLQSSDRTAMYMLLQNHFQGITWNAFEIDLKRKNWVLLLKNETSNTLQGFSTLNFCQKTINGEKISVVYSGDTIVDPSAWSSVTLPQSWVAAIKFLRHQYSVQKLYWLLICSGFRTYRFLPTFWQDFYPRYNLKTPIDIENIMGSLAKQYYGDFYEETSGIVRFPYPQTLREGLIEIPSGREKNPHIQFFTQKNPGHINGDELVCITEFTYDNLTRAGKRMWNGKSSLEIVQDYILI
ncbi:hypothetical protein WJM97_03000 [Okeanomitos corallinicola TIOX110]|jgi:hypothetical protein|uniref:GNAT family N-acetyltransferase n=1 Tax=Okeanomitos corallinicola TIOX110 TaxID=3133117 RepID=A0ABZ2UZ23_9CYAN